MNQPEPYIKQDLPDGIEELNLNTIRDPNDPKFQKWIKGWIQDQEEKLKQFGKEPADKYAGVEYKFLMQWKAFEKILKYAEKKDVSKDIAMYLIEALGKIKRHIKRLAESNANPIKQDRERDKLLEKLYGGKNLEESLKNLPEDVGKQFSGHGMSKGNGLQFLKKILENGIDSTRPFSEILLRGGEGAGITPDDRPYSDGAFIIVGHPNTSINKGGVKLILINWQFREAARLLAQQYPQYVFAYPEGIEKALQSLITEKA